MLQTLPPAKWGFGRTRNTRDVLEFAAVQLITPNCGSGRLRKGERGKISKTIFTAMLTGLSHSGVTLAPEGYSILLTAAINLVGRIKESKWRAAVPPAIGSQRSRGST
jgi:hypothetical protein